LVAAIGIARALAARLGIAVTAVSGPGTAGPVLVVLILPRAALLLVAAIRPNVATVLIATALVRGSVIVRTGRITAGSLTGIRPGVIALAGVTALGVRRRGRGV
jgi:hypothetical protein